MLVHVVNTKNGNVSSFLGWLSTYPQVVFTFDNAMPAFCSFENLNTADLDNG